MWKQECDPRAPCRLAAIQLTVALLLVLTLGAGLGQAQDCADYSEFLHWEGMPDPTPGDAWCVAISGDYGFVADGDSGLTVIRPNDMVSEYVANLSFPGYSRKIEITGDIAYLAAGTTGFVTVDISDPLNPSIADKIDITGDARGFALAGNFALVSDFDVGGLRVVDISDPNNLAIVNTYPTPADAIDLIVSGDYAYIGFCWGFEIADISALPTISMVVHHADTYCYQGMALEGDYLYAASSQLGMRIWDVSDPTSPLPRGFASLPADARRIAVSGQYAYVTTTWGLHAVDVSNPLIPAVVGNVSTVGFGRYPRLIGDSIYMAGVWGVIKMDIAHATSVEVIGNMDTGGFARGLALADDIAYVADNQAGLALVDISDPLNPSALGTVDTGTSTRVAVSWPYAYLSDMAGLVVVDVSDENAPAIVATTATPNQVTGLALSGDRAYLSADISGLRVMNVSDPEAPWEEGSVLTPGSARAVAVSGSHAYLACYDPELVVADVSNPAIPVIVGMLQTIGYQMQDLAVSGSHAYLAAQDYVVIVDVSDPTAPVEVAAVGTAGNATRVHVVGDILYVADQVAGVLLVDVADPAQPEILGNTIVMDDAFDVAVAGDLLAVADNVAGLTLLPAQCAVTAVPEGFAAQTRLAASYPNPANPKAFIRYRLPAPARVTLGVYDVAGRQVRILESGVSRGAGEHEVIWDGVDAAGQAAPSGVYLYRLEAGGFAESRKLTLLR